MENREPYCTACGKKTKHLFDHPLLPYVKICSECNRRYQKDKNWVNGIGWKDEQGYDEICRWCAEGGELICCDSCTRAFCIECIEGNFGKEECDVITNQEHWKCYVCNPNPLKALQIDKDKINSKSKSTEVHTNSNETNKIESKRKRPSDSIDSEEEFQDGDNTTTENIEKNNGVRKSKRKRKSAQTKTGENKGLKKKVLKKKNKEVDSEGESSKKKDHRRKIKPILEDEDLSRKARKALEAEKKRQCRLEERKRESLDQLEKALEDEHKKPVCINPLREAGEEPIYIIDKIASQLKPHQIEGVRFMWDNCVESVKAIKELKKPGFGCILAHFMGLGKTVQSIAFVHTFLKHNLGRCVLILVPVNVLKNWMEEFHMWLGEDSDIHIFNMESAKTNKSRYNQIEQWEITGGVMLMGYELFRILLTSKKGHVKLREQIKQSLTHVPDLLFVDEGHRIKNEKSELTKALNMIKTKRRIVLTGSPLQNNLTEYYHMVDFVRQNYLGTKADFCNRFVNPIVNGQCVDSTPADVQLMRQRVHILHEKLKGFVHRVDYSVLKSTLPSMREYVLMIRLTKIQKALYKQFIRQCWLSDQKGLFEAYHALMKIWNHPTVLVDSEKAKEMQQFMLDEGLDESIEYSDGEEEEERILSDNEFLDSSDEDNFLEDIREKNEKKDEGKISKWRTRSQQRNSKEEEMKTAEMKPQPLKWFDSILSSFEFKEDSVEASSKIIVALHILDKALKQREKVLIFSQSLVLLDLLERILNKTRNWLKGVDYLRLDGSTSTTTRQKNIHSFNDKDSEKNVFLISTKAGSLGVNLVGANRVIIFDASWNPSHDIQSVFRAYRYGQTKPVFIYRLIADGTMEQKIYERQVLKQGLSMRVVDEQQIGRLFSKEDLQELFAYYDSDDETPGMREKKNSVIKPNIKGENDLINKDIILEDLLRTFNQSKGWIKSYHLHSSLLEEDEEEKLTEAEIKEAIENYEAEIKAEQKRPRPGEYFQFTNPNIYGSLQTPNLILQQFPAINIADIPINLLTGSISPTLTLQNPEVQNILRRNLYSQVQQNQNSKSAPPPSQLLSSFNRSAPLTGFFLQTMTNEQRENLLNLKHLPK